jgi:hypothetical protein
MNKLNYSIWLREKGLDSNDIKKKMKEKGFEESEIQYYLKKSDEIFLKHLIRNNKTSKSKGKLGKGIKMVVLGLSLLLLISAFLGYARIGLIVLFIIWSLVGFSSFR